MFSIESLKVRTEQLEIEFSSAKSEKTKQLIADTIRDLREGIAELERKKSWVISRQIEADT